MTYEKENGFLSHYSKKLESFTENSISLAFHSWTSNHPVSLKSALDYTEYPMLCRSYGSRSFTYIIKGIITGQNMKNYLWCSD